MENEIIGICGNGSLAELELIGNDPNFVFVNDVNFPTLVLYNDQGSVINVNSWIECANYVNGGWFDGVYDLINGEKYVFFTRMEDGAHLVIEDCFDKSKGRVAKQSTGAASHSWDHRGYNRAFRSS